MAPAPDKPQGKGGSSDGGPPKPMTELANQCSCGQKFTSSTALSYHKERTGHV